MVHTIIQTNLHNLISQPSFMLTENIPVYSITEHMEIHYRDSILHQFILANNLIPEYTDSTDAFLALRQLDINSLFNYIEPDENHVLQFKNFLQDEELLETQLTPIPNPENHHYRLTPNHRIACNRYGDCFTILFTDITVIITFLEAGQH